MTEEINGFLSFQSEESDSVVTAHMEKARDYELKVFGDLLYLTIGENPTP